MARIKRKERDEPVVDREPEGPAFAWGPSPFGGTDEPIFVRGPGGWWPIPRRLIDTGAAQFGTQAVVDEGDRR